MVPPLTAAGINQAAGKNITSSLESLASALEPFGDMTTDQFAGLLRAAQEYRTTGILPVAPSKTSRAKGPKAPKMTPMEALAKLQDIEARALDMEPSAISDAVQGLSSLTVKELELVQKEFLGAVLGKKKDQALAALKKRLDDARSNSERVETIRAI